MTYRTLAAAMWLLTPAAAIPQTDAFTPVPAGAIISFDQHPLVHKVSCREGSGTAFRVGARRFYSAAHVTALHECTVEGKPIAITEQDGKRDFAQFDVDLPANRNFKVNCAGFVPGQWYFAVGFALGAPWQTVIAVYATSARYPDGKRVLIGPHDFIPGMSGGPVLDASGQVVGVVNAFIPGTPISLSRELHDTSICGANIA